MFEEDPRVPDTYFVTSVCFTLYITLCLMIYKYVITSLPTYFNDEIQSHLFSTINITKMTFNGAIAPWPSGLERCSEWETF